MRKHGGRTIAIRALRVAVCLALLAPLFADAAHAEVAAAAFLGDTVNPDRSFPRRPRRCGRFCGERHALMRARNRPIENAELRHRTPT
jgi:hypothetical protein